MINSFILIFAFIFVFAAISVFTTMKRIRGVQNRIFDHIDRELDRSENEQDDEPDNRPRNYECDQCGAALGDNSEISPSGDFKCTYCGKWSNIHN